MSRSISQGFDFLINSIKPLNSEHEKAASHKDSVKRCLENNFGCSYFFETGSFGNGTGVRHHSDTDYFARCPGGNFYLDSSKTLRIVKEALQRTFPRTPGIEVKSPAVRIPFGKYASERLELTPAYYNALIETPVGKRHAYNIPSHDGGWMKSSPTAHIAYVNREDLRLGGKLKPLIQLIKAWKFYNEIPIYSFYLELRVTKYAELENSIIFDIDIKNIIKFLYENDLPRIQDPMGISGYVNPCKSSAKKDIALSKLKTGYGRVVKAYNERDVNVDNAFYWWNLFYNGKFPSR